MRTRLTLILIGLSLSLAPAFAKPKAKPKADIAAGQKLVEENCAVCHATGKTDESPNPKSPPFRNLSKKYPLKDLEESLAEGILVGHEGPEMPQFQIDPPQIRNLLAYLTSIQAK